MTKQPLPPTKESIPVVTSDVDVTDSEQSASNLDLKQQRTSINSMDITIGLTLRENDATKEIENSVSESDI